MLREILLEMKAWEKEKKKALHTPFLWKEHLELEHFKLAKYDSPEHSCQGKSSIRNNLFQTKNDITIDNLSDDHKA